MGAVNFCLANARSEHTDNVLDVAVQGVVQVSLLTLIAGWKDRGSAKAALLLILSLFGSGILEHETWREFAVVLGGDAGMGSRLVLASLN